jgi:hypothetical protein
MGKPLQKPEASLYERDFYAWLRDQATQLRARSHNNIDWENLAEEIESVGRSERREIESRLALLILHLLKWQFQPGRRSESWKLSIGEQRTWIPGIIRHSPSLKGYPSRIFASAYEDGQRRAINETGPHPSVFPSEPPFTVKEALDYRFWPGEPVELHVTLLD